MDKMIYVAGVVVVILLIQLALGKLRAISTMELDKVLYDQNNPKLYLELLKNKKLKLLYRKSILLQFALDAYLIAGDDLNTERMISQLNTFPMTKRENLEFNQKKLSYYCKKGNCEESMSALTKIKTILSKSKEQRYLNIISESELIYEIYIQHNIKLIEPLETHQKTQTGIDKGLTLYRLAKLSYYAKNEKNAIHYLNLAKSYLVGTYWFVIIDSALKDLSFLEKN